MKNVHIAQNVFSSQLSNQQSTNSELMVNPVTEEFDRLENSQHFVKQSRALKNEPGNKRSEQKSPGGLKKANELLRIRKQELERERDVSLCLFSLSQRNMKRLFAFLTESLSLYFALNQQITAQNIFFYYFCQKRSAIGAVKRKVVNLDK